MKGGTGPSTIRGVRGKKLNGGAVNLQASDRRCAQRQPTTFGSGLGAECPMIHGPIPFAKIVHCRPQRRPRGCLLIAWRRTTDKKLSSAGAPCCDKCRARHGERPALPVHFPSKACRSSRPRRPACIHVHTADPSQLAGKRDRLNRHNGIMTRQFPPSWPAPPSLAAIQQGAAAPGAPSQPATSADIQRRSRAFSSAAPACLCCL